MEIKVVREKLTDKSTVGKMYIDGAFFCYTLEDVVRETKIYGETAIPTGRYEVIVNFSNRFQQQMPLLLKVPNYEGVRIHPGNSAKDTHGCILVGEVQGEDFIGKSKIAYANLMARLRKVSKLEKIWIEVA